MAIISAIISVSIVPDFTLEKLTNLYIIKLLLLWIAGFITGMIFVSQE